MTLACGGNIAGDCGAYHLVDTDGKPVDLPKKKYHTRGDLLKAFSNKRKKLLKEK